MKRLIAGVLLLASSAFCAWPNGYTYRRAITIDYTKVAGSANLTDFPVLFSGTYAYLKTTANGGKVEHGSGYDIRFETTSGAQLKHEVESWSATTGAVVVWIKVPTVSYTTNTEFYLYYGKSGLSATEADPTNVWASSYMRVYHLPNGTTLTAADSTSNAQNGTVGAAASAGAGQIYGSAAFTYDTSNSNVSFPDTENVRFTSSFTISFWTKNGTEGAKYILSKDNKYAVIYDYTDKQVELFSASYTGDNPRTGSGLTLDDTTTWHHFAYTYNGSVLAGYRDGVQVFSSAKSFTLGTSSVAGYIGASGSATADNYGGLVDEVRLLNAAVSAGWVATEVNSQGSPGTFYGVGDETTSSVVRRKGMVVFQ